MGFIIFQWVSGGWLGIMVQDLTPQLAIRHGLLVTEGVIVARVEFNSPAFSGGLEEGDVIITVNDKKIPNAEILKKVISKLSPGKLIQLTVLRDRREKVLKIQLGAKRRDAA